MTVIRTATEDDWPAIWPIWHAVVAAGETYPYPPDTGYDEGRRLWMLPPPAEVLVLEDDGGKVRATVVLRPNHPGLGAHVANAGFMVDPEARGQGLGRQIGEATLDRAREKGYRAMQFNAVVSTNTTAIRLWKSMGMEIVGTVPEAFHHPTKGFVDFLVMYQKL